MTQTWPVCGLISNAGAYPRVPWHDHDPATFARQIDVNLLTHATVMHLLTPGLTASGTGRIVAVSSVLTQLGRIDLAGYIAAESAIFPDDPAAAAEEIQRRREEIGLSYFVFGADSADALAPVVAKLAGR